MRKSAAEETAVAQADDIEFVDHLTVNSMELLSDFCRGAVLCAVRCADLAGGWIAELHTQDCPSLRVHL